jgi:hypothetical protein
MVLGLINVEKCKEYWGSRSVETEERHCATVTDSVSDIRTLCEVQIYGAAQKYTPVKKYYGYQRRVGASGQGS